MNKCGHQNVRKQQEINNGDKYTKYGQYDFTSSEPKDYLGILVKGLITSLGIKTKVRSKKKKARYEITNVSMKDFPNMIKKFEKLPYEGYARKRPKL